MTLAELTETLMTQKGTMFAGLDYEGPAYAKAPYRKVTKRTTVNVIPGATFGNMVDHIPGERKNGTVRVTGTPLAYHPRTEKYYLDVPVWHAKLTGYYAEDGTEIARDTIRPYLKPASLSVPHANGKDEVVWRNYMLARILRIRMNGEEYTITG